MNKKVWTPSQLVLNLVLVGFCLIGMLPFLWTLATSLRTPAKSFSMPPAFLPDMFNWANYRAVFVTFPFLRFIFNSLLAAGAVVLLSLTISSMAAYAFARLTFKGRNVLFVVFMAGLMIPGSVTIVSVYIIMAKAHLVGSLWAVILPMVINPLHIFLMRQFMMTIPKSYDEAAEIDGCGHLRIFWHVILPMSKPVLILAGLQAFIASWNNFIGPLIYLTDYNQMTLPVGLRALAGYMRQGNVSEIMAGVVVSLIVPILFYVFAQRHLVEGIALSGVK